MSVASHRGKFFVFSKNTVLGMTEWDLPSYSLSHYIYREYSNRALAENQNYKDSPFSILKRLISYNELNNFNFELKFEDFSSDFSHPSVSSFTYQACITECLVLIAWIYSGTCQKGEELRILSWCETIHQCRAETVTQLCAGRLFNIIACTTRLFHTWASFIKRFHS